MKPTRIGVVLGLFLLCVSPVLGQPTSETDRLPWPAHNKIVPSISAVVTYDSANGKARYRYTLKSLPAGEQNIYAFDVLVEAEPDEIDSPANWTGLYESEFYLPKPPRICWVTSLSENNIAPGASLTGFVISGQTLPGIVDSQSTGWADLINMDEVPPERLPVGLVPDEIAFVVVKTVGPVFPLEAAEANPAALGSHLVSQAVTAQGLGWLASSLQVPNKLQSLQTALAAHNTSLSATKIAELQALLTAQQGQGVTSDGYALLQPSLAFLATKFPPPTSPDLTLQSSKDAFVYDRGPHVNEGANPRLPLKKITGKPAQFAVGFDLAGINTAGLTKGTLVLSIDSANNVTGWGNGRTIRARRLTTEWVEGNGKSLDLHNNQKTAGSGQGVTWFSPVDTDIGNNQANSTVNWNGGGSFTSVTTAPLVSIQNHDSGEVRFDVTQDTLAGASNGWLVTRDDDVGSQVTFFSREGALAAGNPELAPRLILEYESTAMDDTRGRGVASLIDIPGHRGQVAAHPEALTNGHFRNKTYRTVTGKLLQPALMDYANGDHTSYDDRTERQRVRNPMIGAAHAVSQAIPLFGPLLGEVLRGVGWVGNLLGISSKQTGTEQIRTVTGMGKSSKLPGLTQLEMARLCEGLFGQKPDLLGANLKALNLIRLMSSGERPNYTDVRGSLVDGAAPMFAMMDTDQKATPEGLKRSWLGQRLQDHGGVLAELFDGRPPDSNASHNPARGLHWVYITRIEEGRVYFEDPNRVSAQQLLPETPSGGHPLSKRRHRPPGYHVEEDGTASMPVLDFQTTVWALLESQGKVHKVHFCALEVRFCD